MSRPLSWEDWTREDIALEVAPWGPLEPVSCIGCHALFGYLRDDPHWNRPDPYRCAWTGVEPVVAGGAIEYEPGMLLTTDAELPMKPGELTGEVFAPHGAAKVPEGKRAALYMRVSTEEQTTANQRPELARIAKARGLGIVLEYRETMSAAKRRPVFDRMLADSHAGAFDVLLVWALDRFGRSMVGNLELVTGLDERGIRIISARETWLDTGSPARNLLIGIFSWVAEQERARLAERTIAGMARARAAGKQIGRPRAHVPIALARSLLKQPGATRVSVAWKLKTSPASLARALARDEASAESPKGVSRRKGSK